MKKRKIILSCLCLLLSSSVLAEIMECFSFSVSTGQSNLVVSQFQSMAEWHETNGALPGIYVFNVGGQGEQVDYCLRWDDPASWAAFKDKAIVQMEKKIKTAKKPTGTFPAVLIASRLLTNIDPEVKASTFKEPFVWNVLKLKPADGREQEVLDRLRGFKKFAEKSGNRSEIYEDHDGGDGSYFLLTMNTSWKNFVAAQLKGAEEKQYQEFMSAGDRSMYADGQYYMQANGHSVK